MMEWISSAISFFFVFSFLVLSILYLDSFGRRLLVLFAGYWCCCLWLSLLLLPRKLLTLFAVIQNAIFCSATQSFLRCLLFVIWTINVALWYIIYIRELSCVYILTTRAIIMIMKICVSLDVSQQLSWHQLSSRENLIHSLGITWIVNEHICQK